MAVQDPSSHPLAGAGLDRRFLGLSRHAGTGYAKRPGEVWLVFHGDWTGVHRLDPRDRRTVHLERALDGDRREDALAWAVETFAIAPSEPARGPSRVLAAANSDAPADDRPRAAVQA